MVIFPPDPIDGQTIAEEQPDGSIVIWTYNEALNQWTYKQYGGVGDEFVYTNQVLTVPNQKIYDEFRAAGGDLPPDPKDGPPGNVLKTQEDVNNFIASASTKALKQQTRTNDNLDYIQNTVTAGFWVYLVADGSGQLPDVPGSFFMFDDASNPIEKGGFADAKRFIFNGKSASGIPAQFLNEVRPGAYMVLGATNRQAGGHWLVVEVEFGGDPADPHSQYYAQIVAFPIDNRAYGEIEQYEHIQVKFTSPIYTVVKSAAKFGPPKAAGPGVLWWDQETKQLAVNTWEAGEGPNDAKVEWVVINGGGGDVDLSGYLPLTGGKLTGKLEIENIGGDALVINSATGGSLLKVFTGKYSEDALYGKLAADYGSNKLEIVNRFFLEEYVSNNTPDVDLSGYLPLTGGDLSGLLNINVGSGVALSVNNNKVKFWSSGAVELNGYSSFKDNELVTKAYTDNAIKTAVEGVDVPEVASPFRQLRFARDKDWNNLRPGEFGLMDKSNNYTAQWSEVSQIYFHGVDTDGNRLMRDENMQSWSSFLGSAVTVLTSSGTRPLLRVAPTVTGLATWVMIEWDKDSDVFYIGWQEPKCAALLTGTNNNLSNGQNFLFHIPDLFF